MFSNILKRHRKVSVTDKIRSIVPQKYINYKHRFFSKIYTTIYSNPSGKLEVIGVTGTDGKTTTCTLLYEILREAGFKTAMVTTISARIGDETIPTGFHVTTPEPRMLQKLLKKMVDEEIEFVILETTSHGLDQFRLGGIRYHAGIYTNVTHEHLDYHKSYESYLETKAKLIEMISPGGFVVINNDDNSAPTLLKKAKSYKLKTYTYGFDDRSDLWASDYKDSTSVTSFKVHWGDHAEKIEMHLPGDYNVYNSLGAIQVAIELGIDIGDTKKALKKVTTLEGRWEVIQKKPFKVVVDFAHTPNSLEKMLQYARIDNKNGKIILVFGSAGKRDIDKRELMGRTAGNYADIVVLTAEDPRGESVTNINRQIAVGLNEVGRVEDRDYFSIENRGEAISFATNLANNGDTVIISGKGHEKSMNLDGENEIPWSDQMIVKEILMN